MTSMPLYKNNLRRLKTMYEQNDSFATGYALGRDSNDNNNGMFGGDWAW